jgi:hypothetical protein
LFFLHKCNSSSHIKALILLRSARPLPQPLAQAKSGFAGQVRHTIWLDGLILFYYNPFRDGWQSETDENVGQNAGEPCTPQQKAGNSSNMD